MASVGPTLPPHLASKRKRSVDDLENSSASSPELQPSRPPSSASPESTQKRQRIIGPSLPPAPIDEKPTEPPDTPGHDTSDDEDDDGDLGPSLPPVGSSKSSAASASQTINVYQESEADTKPKREEWMLAPPTQGDWTSKVDPTKLRNRKFNTGKGAKAPAAKMGGDSVIWTETPEQKRQRLADEVMGVRKPATAGPDDQKPSKSAAEAAHTAQRIAEYNKSNRAQSLYEDHKKTEPKEQEDDPSARGFDREKDMASGRQIGHAKRKEMVQKAADFGSRFSGGSYL